jgi:hypothetical protein
MQAQALRRPAIERAAALRLNCFGAERAVAMRAAMAPAFPRPAADLQRYAARFADSRR